jgi:hypothetical protein
MVLRFSTEEKARKVLENGHLSRVGGQIVDWYRMTASDLRALGNLECIVDFHS